MGRRSSRVTTLTRRRRGAPKARGCRPPSEGGAGASTCLGPPRKWQKRRLRKEA